MSMQLAIPNRRIISLKPLRMWHPLGHERVLRHENGRIVTAADSVVTAADSQLRALAL